MGSSQVAFKLFFLFFFRFARFFVLILILCTPGFIYFFEFDMLFDVTDTAP